MKNKIDKRTIRTKEAIKEALMALLSTTPLSKINIKDLAEVAQINRKTFYLHYDKTMDVIDEIENDMIHNIIMQTLTRQEFLSFIENPYTLLVDLVKKLKNDKRIYTFILNNDYYGHLFEKIKKNLADLFIKMYYNETGSNQDSIVNPICFAIAGSIEVIHQWLISPKQKEISTLCKEIASSITYGIKPAIKI